MLSAVIAGLLVAYLALFPAAFALIVAIALRRFGTRALLLAAPAWVATELARTLLFGGFPWALLGYTQTTVLPIAQGASLFGVYGLSFLVVLVSASLAVRGSGAGSIGARRRSCCRGVRHAAWPRGAARGSPTGV